MEGSVYTKWVESSGVQVRVERECRCVCGGVCAVYGESEWGLVVCRCVCGVWRRECVGCVEGVCRVCGGSV